MYYEKSLFWTQAGKTTQDGWDIIYYKNIIFKTEFNILFSRSYLAGTVTDLSAPSLYEAESDFW